MLCIIKYDLFLHIFSILQLKMMFLISSEAALATATTVIEKTDNIPGTYEELHRKCRDLFPICFDGAKLMVMKLLSSHLQVSFFLFNYLYYY